MKLNYNGQDKVQAPPAAVWAFVQDPERVARCLPDVQDVRVSGPQQLTATVNVGSGLVRGKLKFNIDVQPDEDRGQVNVLIRGGGLGNAVDMTAAAKVVDNGDGTTTLDWQGDAEMRGPLANVGGRMLDSQVQKIIARTFQNMSSEIAKGSKKLA